nr:hypothetical protein [uncultured Acetobacter sp.]
MTETTSPEDKTWRVRIMDQSGGAEDNITEEVGGFHDLAHANAFARAYTRDSVERCRMPGSSAKDVLTAWLSFGEDAIVQDAGEDGWHSANELDDFAATRATPMERDWRALDPRRLVEDEDEVDAVPDEHEDPSFD